MNKKCFFLSPTANLDGAERVIFNLVSYLLENDYDVTVYIMSRGIQPGWESIAKHPNLNLIIKPYSSEKTSLPALFYDLIYLSHKNSYDYAFSSLLHINSVLSLMRKFKLFKTTYLIGRESTFIFNRFKGNRLSRAKYMYNHMYGSHDLLICQTERMKSSLISNLGFIPAKQVEVIPNPVNLNYIQQQLNDSRIEHKPFKTLIVGCGRLIPLKGFDKLINAFANSMSVSKDIGLVIIGDGPERQNLENIVKSLDIENEVIFTGKISNPIKWFNMADIGVISSEVEGFPNVLIEMMASGTKHVITTPCTDGVNNIPHIHVTESCSAESIEISLRKYLKTPVDNSEKGIKFIKDSRSVDSFWKTIRALLEQ